MPWHCRRAASAALVAVADFRPPEAGSVGPDVAVFADLDALLAATAVDIVVVCTPIHTHRQLAEAAMRAGADVLLEKPPVPTMAEFSRLLALCAETGRSCQIGFQSLGSQAVWALAAAVAADELGAVRLISTRCAWIRSVDYFGRSRWAGHRELDGVPVMDGVLSNPFAHAVATALRVDGSTRVEDVLTVETDLFRANNISSDDTSTVRVTTRRGTTLLFAATLCSPVVDTPEVIVGGTSATATLRYTSDEIGVTGPAGELLPSELTGSYGRDNLLANLIEHRGNPAVPLIADVRRDRRLHRGARGPAAGPGTSGDPAALLRLAGGRIRPACGGRRRAGLDPPRGRARSDLHRIGCAVDPCCR